MHAPTYQSFLSRFWRSQSQIISFRVKGLDFYHKVTLGLFEPQLQQLLHVNVLPGVCPGIHINFLCTYSWVAVPFRRRLQVRYLDEDRGWLLSWSEIDPEQGLQDAVGQNLWAQWEHATLRHPVKMGDGLRCKVLCLLRPCTPFSVHTLRKKKISKYLNFRGTTTCYWGNTFKGTTFIPYYNLRLNVHNSAFKDMLLL